MPKSVKSKKKKKKSPSSWRWAILGAAAAGLAAIILVPLLRGQPKTHAPQNHFAQNSLWKQIVHLPIPNIPISFGAQPPMVVPASQRPSQAPDVLFVGADYCPFCAANRWPLIIALSRFGHFTALSPMESSSTDVYPNTHTWTFYKSHYSSPYITLQTVERAKRTAGPNGAYPPLQTETPAQSKILSALDAPPYVPPQGANSVPFLLIGSRYLWIGSVYSPQLLGGLGWSTIVHDVKTQSYPIGKVILVNANVFTAAICLADGNKPANVCTVATIRQDENALVTIPPK